MFFSTDQWTICYEYTSTRCKQCYGVIKNNKKDQRKQRPHSLLPLTWYWARVVVQYMYIRSNYPHLLLRITYFILLQHGWTCMRKSPFYECFRPIYQSGKMGPTWKSIRHVKHPWGDCTIYWTASTKIPLHVFFEGREQCERDPPHLPKMFLSIWCHDDFDVCSNTTCL